jgi:hypothetical protein
MADMQNTIVSMLDALDTLNGAKLVEAQSEVLDHYYAYIKYLINDYPELTVRMNALIETCLDSEAFGAKYPGVARRWRHFMAFMAAHPNADQDDFDAVAEEIDQAEDAAHASLNVLANAALAGCR